ncbi:cytochrome P450 [Haliangium ochraceum]|uniref:Cytochrome P450 n=1 Tax=Haliangium ochraceum (strain DSM 14365 / JCM 11303 / SMP-2) TaxID=502025 RepID=D0LP64_HALO1|nr:cytochrome P450 [Haliangium ochraceum]ACY13429.1 cytochrome P450 [Haliangium ochraceum DSM 14365]
MASVAGLPPAAPLARSLAQLARDPLAFLTEGRERYGDIYRLGLGGMHVVLLHHPRHAHHVFREHYKNYGKGGALWEALRDYLGNGLLVTEGDLWLRQRRLLQPLFKRTNIDMRMSSMYEIVTRVLDSWGEECAQTGSLDLVSACARLSMGVSTGSMFGSALTHEDTHALMEEVRVVVDSMVWNMLTRRIPQRLRPGYARYRKAMDHIHSALDGLIDHYQRSEDGDDGLLAMFSYIEDSATGARMSRELMRDETLDLLLGAYETTAQALAWTFYCILQHAEVERRLRAEIGAVLGARRPELEDLKQLPYVVRVIREALRVYPPGAWITRTTREDDEIDGHHIAAGTTVAVVTYAIHHHPAIWEQPERFEPERFLPEADAARERCAWIPFGSGPRVCMGMDFAMLELALAVILALQRYDIQRVTSGPIAPRLRTTLTPAEPLEVRLHLRPGDA